MYAGVRTARALIGILAIVTLPTLASNLDFLHDTPLSDFNEEDRRLFAAAMTKTLSEASDNETRRWSNPDTKSGGEITPLRTQSRGNTVCRDVSTVNRAKGRTEKSVYSYCREGEGEWRLSFQKPK